MILKTLSPFHIGNGNELTSLDIYPGDSVVHVLDTERLTGDLMNLGVSLDEILHLLKNPPGDAYVWKGYIDELHLNPADYALYTLKVHGEPGKRSMQIKEFIKLNGRPYIPGSSLKGAIRTAVLYKVLKECGDSSTAMRAVSKAGGQKTAEKIGYSESLVEYYIGYLEDEIRKSERRRRNFDTKRADDHLEAIIFGMETDRWGNIHYEPKKDPMRALIVRDSQPLGRKHLALYRVDVIGNPQPIPIWVEAVEPGTAVEVEIVIDKELLRLNSTNFNGLLWECLKERGKPWEAFEEFLWEAVGEFYRDVIRAELKDIGKFGGHGRSVRAFYSSLDGYSGHLLRLGWGSGWVAMTVGMLLIKERKWEHIRKKLGLGKKPGGRGFSREFPKTRRLADGIPMGWVVLR